MISRICGLSIPFLVTFLLCSISVQISLASGKFVPRVWKDESGESHKYVIFEPDERYLVNSPPLILFLNGFGENGSDGFNQARANFGPAIWEKRHRFPFLAVFPQCASKQSWSADDGNQLSKAISILDQVIDDYQADRTRIYVTGASTGGAGAWNAAAKYPNKFAAAAPLCARIDFELLPQIKESQIPIWNFCCQDERERLLQHNRTLIDKLRLLGATPLYSETPGEGHNCWDYVYRMPALYEWFLNHRLTKANKRKIVKQLDWLPIGSTTPPSWPAIDKSEIIATEDSHNISLDQILKAWGEREAKIPHLLAKWSWDVESDGYWSGNLPFWEAENGSPHKACSKNKLLLVNNDYYYTTLRHLNDNALLLSRDLSNRYDLAAVKKFEDLSVGKQELFELTRFDKNNMRVDRYRNSSRTIFENTSIPSRQLLFDAKTESTTDLDTLGYAPLIMHYRAVSSKVFGLQPAFIELDEKFYSQDGKELIRLTERLSETQHRVYFVDPEMDYSITKLEAYQQERLVASLQIHYSTNLSLSVPTPVHWVVEYFHGKHDRWPSYQIAKIDEIITEKGIVETTMPTMAASKGDAIFERDSATYFMINETGLKEEVHYSQIEKLIALQKTQLTNMGYLLLAVGLFLITTLTVIYFKKFTS